MLGPLAVRRLRVAPGALPDFFRVGFDFVACAASQGPTDLAALDEPEWDVSREYPMPAVPHAVARRFAPKRSAGSSGAAARRVARRSSASGDSDMGAEAGMAGGGVVASGEEAAVVRDGG